MRGERSLGERSARGALAAAVAAVVLLLGVGPASAFSPEMTMTGSPGPGKTVTLSGLGCGSGEGTLPVFLVEAPEGTKVVAVVDMTADESGDWSVEFPIPTETPDGPIVEGEQYAFFVLCGGGGAEDPTGLQIQSIAFTMGAPSGPTPPPEPEPSPDPEPAPEPEPAPTPPPVVQGETVVQPPAPAAAPAQPVTAPRSLAFTGDGTERLGAAGAAVLALGLVVVGLGRRVRYRPAPPA